VGSKSKTGLRIRQGITALRRVRDVCILAANRTLHREYIPSITQSIYIEPTSICNLRCRFCGYRKKQSPKCVMPYERFCDYVNQATELGYTRFNLTPLTGEVFADRRLFDKLAFLDQHPRVLGYSFFSNFTLASPQIVEQLFTLKKLRKLTISLYGHDRDSFTAITWNDESLHNLLNWASAGAPCREGTVVMRHRAANCWRSSSGFRTSTAFAPISAGTTTIGAV
jgi:MoaA/NifB/PqqE/SkfB family radical SAM enzyme